MDVVLLCFYLKTVLHSSYGIVDSIICRIKKCQSGVCCGACHPIKWEAELRSAGLLYCVRTELDDSKVTLGNTGMLGVKEKLFGLLDTSSSSKHSW